MVHPSGLSANDNRNGLVSMQWQFNRQQTVRLGLILLCSWPEHDMPAVPANDLLRNVQAESQPTIIIG